MIYLDSGRLDATHLATALHLGSRPAWLVTNDTHLRLGADELLDSLVGDVQQCCCIPP